MMPLNGLLKVFYICCSILRLLFARISAFLNTWVLFSLSYVSGMRSYVDVGVISGEREEPHYFINVADIHL